MRYCLPWSFTWFARLAVYPAHADFCWYGLYYCFVALWVASYAANHFIGYGSASVVMLIANHLGPGLTVNLILFVIVYGPLHRLLMNLAEE